MEVGDRFPEFRLRDENGEELDSSSLEGIRYVIYFYPKDNTPGCTKEAEEFSASIGQFLMRNIPVIGVSKDSVESHRRFIDKHQLRVKLQDRMAYYILKIRLIEIFPHVAVISDYAFLIRYYYRVEVVVQIKYSVYPGSKFHLTPPALPVSSSDFLQGA